MADLQLATTRQEEVLGPAFIQSHLLVIFQLDVHVCGTEQGIANMGWIPALMLKCIKCPIPSPS